MLGDCKSILHHHVCMRCLAGALSEVDLFQIGSGICQNMPLGVLLVWLVRSSSGVF